MPSKVVNKFQVKSLDNPDERRFPPKTEVDVVRVDDFTLARITFEPGWRWSENIKPVVHTESCQLNHVGICLAGTLEVVTDDGERAKITAGDSYAIPPGHDAWVVGDEPVVGFEFLSATEYGKPQ